jgi:hypothetical protein
MMPFLVAVSATSIACVVLSKLARRYVGRPKALRVLVKKPFTLIAGDPRRAQRRSKTINIAGQAK